jgi:hypothetical protein
VIFTKDAESALADHLGRKLIVTVGLAAFTAASLSEGSRATRSLQGSAVIRSERTAQLGDWLAGCSQRPVWP